MKDYREYVEIIRDIAAPLVRPGMSLGEDTEMVGELGLTSLQVMSVIEQIEDHLDMSIPLNSLPDIRTVGDLARLLEKLDA